MDEAMASGIICRRAHPWVIVNVRRGIFQDDCLSPLLFVLALIPLSIVLRRVKAGYDLASRKGLLNHLLFMNDLKLYGKNEKQVDTLINTVRVFSSDIACNGVWN